MPNVQPANLTVAFLPRASEYDTSVSSQNPVLQLGCRRSGRSSEYTGLILKRSPAITYGVAAAFRSPPTLSRNSNTNPFQRN
uniref:Uncharacterized protein n=1 Tax=Oryza sativa subsp. japonica TaxID=39947 RepID=Q8GVI6_ORYSJ|nr:hypothetical protein [Oryza sativa Japonica Group]